MKTLTALLLLVPLAALADTTTFVCDYKTSSDAENGLQKVTKPFILTFVIDNENEKSYMVGNNGSNEVITISRGDGLTFVEVTETGNVMTTTIVKSGATVHSRNTAMFGELIASQYYGQCELR